MRWLRPSDGDRRIKKRFLILPRKINCEVRWLEVAYLLENYVIHFDDISGWEALRFATKVEYEEYQLTGEAPKW